jgi:GNAT superfamily N-acetyltransferase
MHGSIERARWIEAAAWADVVEGASPLLQADLGLAVRRWGGTTLLRASRVDSLLFNRVLGLADAGPDAGSIVDEAIRCFEIAGVSRFFIHVPARAERWSRLLQHRGLAAFHRPWVKLVRGRAGPRVVGACELEIGATRVDEARAWAKLLTEGLEIGDAGIPLLAATVGRPGWTSLVARDGKEIVGAAAMFVRHGIASLVGASTHPEYRRRGIQHALVGRRVAMALDLGCTTIASETGIAVSGQPNSSCNNMRRCGMEIAATIDNYAWPNTAWVQV